MIEVVIDSIRVSLMSNNRVVMLKDSHTERYLPIWIGPFEAEAITYKLQDYDVPRPLTHDLLNNLIQDIGGELKHVLVSDLREDIFYANIVLSLNGQEYAIDARPSDAIALAVRAQVPIFVSEKVMDIAITPDEDVEISIAPAEAGADDDKLSLFKDFVDSLDMDDLDQSGS